MKYRYFLPLFLSIYILLGTTARAQLIGTSAYLQGHWLEIGVLGNGSFGAPSAPAGYHPHMTGTLLSEVYDYHHDGWTVGTPPYMGDYTYPGAPCEGWAIQANGLLGQAYVGSGIGFTGTIGMAGSLTSYVYSPGRMVANWAGSALPGSALTIQQETLVDTEASWVVVTTTFTNASGTIINDLYYLRTCDPDNAATWSSPTGGYTTDNTIVHQDDADHRVMVSSTDPGYGADTSYFAMATKDCRAKAYIQNSGLSPIFELSDIYDKTGGASSYIYSGLYTNDVGTGLVYKLGNLAPGAKAIISYAYTFNDNSGIDGAFPEPQLVVNGVAAPPSGPAPAPTFDTFNMCDNPGIATIPVRINNATDRCWSWSTWTWAPSLGLAATTGVINTVNPTALSGPITYTITGTDSNANMFSCNHRVMYLTVMPCYHATSNSPCEGDTLHLVAHGDSTGATYLWYGPKGFTNTNQITYIYPSSLSDTGTYYVIKTTGTEKDTVSTYAIVKPLPKVTAGSNAPICSQNTLLLTATFFGPGETFSWTGPTGFTAGVQNPSRPSVALRDSGLYKVKTGLNGCFDSGYTFVKIDSTPVIPVVSSNSPVCSQHGTLSLRSSSATAGVTYSWSGPYGYTSTLQNPDIVAIGMLPTLPTPTTSTGVFTITATLGPCKSSATITPEVDSTPAPPVLATTRVCSGTPLNFTATSMAGADYNWIGPIGYTSSFQNPTINPAITANTGTYTVTASFAYPGVTCTSDPSTIHGQVDSTAEVPFPSSNSPGFPGIAICQSDTLKLFAYDSTFGVTYDWKGPNSFTSTEQHPMIVNVQPNATGTYTVVVTLGFGCVATATTNVVINPTPPLAATSNSPVCSGSRDTLFLQAISSPSATYKWSGPYTFSSTLQNPSRSPVLTEYDGVYQVTALVNGCFATVNDTVIINKTPDVPWMKWLTFCQFYPPDPVQAMGDNILWYSTIQTNPLVGTKTPPVPNTKIVGEKYYYATQTVKGCTSYPDSIKITVYPTPVVTVSASVSVCPHDTALLKAVDTDPIAYYHWYPSMYLSDTSSATVVVRPETNTNYFVVAKNMFGCTDTGYVSVKVKAGAVLDLGDAVTIYPGEKYQLDPATNCSFFNWFPATGLNSTRLSNPVASPLVSTKYIATGITNQGCKVVDSIDIIVKQESVLDMPNAFVPGNGPNSTFKVVKRGIATLRNFSIFDRWGVKVFETTDIEQGWDGTYKGAPQPFGVYIYQVEAITNTGKPFNKTGNVTLIR